MSNERWQNKRWLILHNGSLRWEKSREINDWVVKIKNWQILCGVKALERRRAEVWSTVGFRSKTVKCVTSHFVCVHLHKPYLVKEVVAACEYHSGWAVHTATKVQTDITLECDLHAIICTSQDMRAHRVSHQCGSRAVSWAAPHVNQSSRRRLFARKVIIIWNIWGWSQVFFLFLPGWSIEWSHPNREQDKHYYFIIFTRACCPVHVKWWTTSDFSREQPSINTHNKWL